MVLVANSSTWFHMSRLTDRVHLAAMKAVHRSSQSRDAVRQGPAGGEKRARQKATAFSTDRARWSASLPAVKVCSGR